MVRAPPIVNFSNSMGEFSIKIFFKKSIQKCSFFHGGEGEEERKSEQKLARGCNSERSFILKNQKIFCI